MASSCHQCLPCGLLFRDFVRGAFGSRDCSKDEEDDDFLSAFSEEEASENVGVESLSAEDALTQVNEAFASGRYLHGYRLICQSSLAMDADKMDINRMEKICRIGSIVERSMRLLKTKPSDLPLNGSGQGNLEWGLDYDARFMRMIIRQDRNISAVQAAVLYFERETFHFRCIEFDKTGTCTQLSQPSLDEGVLHIIGSDQFSTEDTVHGISIVDVLDEMGGIAVIVYTPSFARARRTSLGALATIALGAEPDDEGHFLNTPIPKKKEGSTRNPMLFSLDLFYPLPGGGHHHAFVCDISLDPFVGKVMNKIPKFILRKMMARNLLKGGALKEKEANSPDAKELMQKGPRSGVYQRLTRRVEECLAKGIVRAGA